MATEEELIYIQDDVVTGIHSDPGLFGGERGTGKMSRGHVL